ncbi:hypothetical protein SAMN06295910_2202 [Allosphingosinicella indica]|uniref:Uncharacterized protein n=2 Tax=Allosphingosinicella indica TaxID=941907 RepID=A0A1X7GTI5_9SPHN|nr:hypothetical protein SAMN06295910_2202 [Allosphingosinicella indica]
MKTLFAAALTLVAAPAFAQNVPPGAEAVPVEAAPTGGEKVNQLIVYGDDPCPASSADEIIVCARKPEGDRYRIPENLRDNPNAAANQAWTNRATELQYVGSSGIGSCSPVGPGGATGCFDDLVRQAKADRQTRDSVNWNRLIEDARQERLGRIDEQAEQIERELKNDE